MITPNDIGVALQSDLNQYINTQQDAINLLFEKRRDMQNYIMKVKDRIRSQLLLSIIKTNDEAEAIMTILNYPLRAYEVAMYTDEFALEFPFSVNIYFKNYKFKNAKVPNYQNIIQQFTQLGINITEGNFSQPFKVSNKLFGKKSLDNFNCKMKISNKLDEYIVAEQEKIGLVLYYIINKLTDYLVESKKDKFPENFNNCELVFIKLYAEMLIIRALDWGDDTSCKEVERCLLNQLSILLNGDLNPEKMPQLIDVATFITGAYIEMIGIKNDVENNITKNGYCLNPNKKRNVYHQLANCYDPAEIQALKKFANIKQQNNPEREM